MSAFGRGALLVLVAFVLAGAGALGGYAFHWYVVQPSDDELRSVAKGIELDGLSAPAEPIVSGAWPPSFDRGRVHWDAAADGKVTGADVVADLEADGWRVADVAVFGPSETVRASRDGLDVDVHLRGSEAGGTDASVSLTRGDVVPSLTVTVVAGVAVGALVGIALGVWTRRRANRGGV